MKNYFIICLGFILLTQQCLTSPIPDSERLDEHNKFHKEILKEFTDFTIKTGDELVEFLTNVMDEIKQNNESPDGDLTTRRQDKLLRHLEKVKNGEVESNIWDLYKLTEDMIGFSAKDFTAQEEELSKIIEKYKISEFKQKARGAYLKIYDNVLKAFEVCADELKHES
uniref:Uncharacterized protein n=1 Tax=Glossina palpalis gambiensis TaxID=67801 RepID=A0A1B0BE12_9MUSC